MRVLICVLSSRLVENFSAISIDGALIEIVTGVRIHAVGTQTHANIAVAADPHRIARTAGTIGD